MSRYMVFDLETETHERFKRKANPFLQENWVVMRGWKFQGDSRGHSTYHPVHDRKSTLHIPDDVTLLVGQNIKFDLLWELAQGNRELRKFFKRGGKIWDCQYVEYLLKGHTQDVQMVALDDIVEQYGGRRKIDEVKLLWEAGVKTSEISETLLEDYLLGTHAEMRNSGDIGNTEKVFLGQLKIANLQGQLLMIQDRMDGLLCTTEMEFNGLKIDVECAKDRLKVLTRDLSEQTTVLQQSLPTLPWEFNWNSRIQVSALLFGGTVKYQVREPYKDEEDKSPDGWARLRTKETQYFLKDGRLTDVEPTPLTKAQYLLVKSGKKMGAYKTKQVDGWGEKKIKWQDRFYDLQRQAVPDEAWKGAETDAAGKPIYSTAGDIIEEVVARNPGLFFLAAYQRKVDLTKEIGTYYISRDDKGNVKGMLTCVQPWDHMLHHKLNHTSTVTTRLSANDPNMQNIPRVDIDKKTGKAKSEVKRMFVSRFGKDGRMVEIDYSQLEVVVQGVLSRDPQLCEDLRNKIDFHCKRISVKYKISYEDAVAWCKPKEGSNFYPDEIEDKTLNGSVERTKAKVFSFQKAYGAGVAKIALTTGMSVEDVEAFFAAEEALYPGITKFNNAVQDEVNLSAEPFNAFCDVQNRYRVFRKGYYRAPTGTRYCFRTYDAPDYVKRRGQDQTFSPTQLKNYPVQGTGGEFVQAVLGLLFRHFVSADNYEQRAFLVNTVHDCVWIDCHVDVLDSAVRDAVRIMTSIPEYYNTRYGLDIDVPFPVEAEVGLNMMDLEEYHVH